MSFTSTDFPGLLLFQPRVFGDERGYFYESYNRQAFEQAGLALDFVQDNQAYSIKGVFRGLHFQRGASAQAKLVRAIQGAVLDVVLDLRRESPTFGRAYSVVLSAENKLQMLVPRGFAHGYLVLSDTAEFAYKCDNFYDKSAEGGLHYLDPRLQGIDWHGFNPEQLIVSEKDQILPQFEALSEADFF